MIEIKVFMVNCVEKCAVLYASQLPVLNKCIIFISSFIHGINNSTKMSLGVCPVRMYNIVCGDMTLPTHTTQSFALFLYKKWALKGKENLTSVTTRLSQACSCVLQECLACHSSPVHRLTRAKYFKQYPIRVY